MARPQAPVSAAAMPPSAVDHRRRLEALRDRLADAIEVAGARDLAPLAGRYQAVLAELAALPEVKEVGSFDDLARERAKRRAAAKAAQSA